MILEDVSVDSYDLNRNTVFMEILLKNNFHKLKAMLRAKEGVDLFCGKPTYKINPDKDDEIVWTFPAFIFDRALTLDSCWFVYKGKIFAKKPYGALPVLKNQNLTITYSFATGFNVKKFIGVWKNHDDRC